MDISIKRSGSSGNNAGGSALAYTLHTHELIELIARQVVRANTNIVNQIT